MLASLAKRGDVFHFRALPENETPFLSLARAKQVPVKIKNYSYVFKPIVKEVRAKYKQSGV
jgi:hypothetical protein